MTDNIADLIISASTNFYNDLKNDPNGRYRSWEHCYTNFCDARNSDKVDVDYLSLHLSFYLASWGMYRGSSFLLQKDYRVHIPIVKILLEKKYDPLVGIECKEYKKAENQNLLIELSKRLSDYYDKIRRSGKKQDFKNELSSTLITKVLMGTLGCVPAYDRYFVDSVRKYKIASGNYNTKSILELTDFYEENSQCLEATRKKMKVGNRIYPQMKILDMVFWQIGFDNDK